MTPQGHLVLDDDPETTGIGGEVASRLRTAFDAGVGHGLLQLGAAEVTTVAFADEQGHKGWAGGLLAIWALGSLIAGVVSGAVASRSGPAARVRWGAFGMACAMAPLYFVDSIPVMAALLLVGGVAIAPTMIATLSLTERTVPVSRLTEGMAIMHTGIVAGVAPGATISGFVQPGQRELLAPYATAYFEAIERVWRERTIEIAMAVVRGLFPAYPVAGEGARVLAAADAWLSAHEDAAPALRRLVLEARDDFARALRAQECDEAYTDPL